MHLVKDDHSQVNSFQSIKHFLPHFNQVFGNKGHICRISTVFGGGIRPQGLQEITVSVNLALKRFVFFVELVIFTSSCEEGQATPLCLSSSLKLLVQWIT